jgi:hypothetical protein
MLAVRLSEAGVEANEVRTLNTAALLQAGTIYSRRDLATRFEIKDATINNGVFRPKGHNSIWLFITNQKTSDRTPYADRLDGDVLDFDGQTQGGTDSLLIDHAVLGLDVLLFYRERKAAYPGYGFRFEGRFRYVTHKRERPKHFTFSRVTTHLESEEEVVEVVERLTGGRTSQGIAVSPKLRRALEDYSMKRAIAHFVNLGYSVEDVHARMPVDLICRRQSETCHVEVKSTQTIGEEILLTPNEVEYARQNRGSMTLFVVHSVRASEIGGEIEIAGGEERVLDWNIDEGLLTSVGYRYRIPT